MTDQDMIDQLVERHPEWADDEHVVAMRVRGIKNLIRQAFQEGLNTGRWSGSKQDKSIFEQIFGKS